MHAIENKKHAAKVAAIQKSVKTCFQAKKKVRIYHGGSNSTRPLALSAEMIDVSQLKDILEIDVTARTATVEANMPLDTLLAATLPHGLMPAVVSEFPGITVGGAIQGGAGESGSYRWGCLHASALEYELVLPDGRVVRANSEQNRDLFNGVPCSYGSIAILTSVTLQLVPAPEQVELTYQLVQSHQDALSALQAAAAAQPLFLDAIMFTPDRGVVMIGQAAGRQSKPRARFTRFTDEWFYVHADNISKKHSDYSETIPIRDYLFRYDRGAFWVGRDGFRLFHIPFSRFTRIWFASLMKTRTLYRFLHGSGLSQQFIIQDVCLPEKKVVDFVAYTDKKFDIYPLWLCPLKPDDAAPMAPNFLNTEMVINVGLWGRHHRPHQEFVADNRRLEQLIDKLGGRKVLYAHTYYRSKEFWSIYDRSGYDRLRATYQAGFIFRNIFDKVTVTKQLKPSLSKGWVALFKSPF